MKIAGIIAEYNPFHTGHAYQIACTREQLGADCAIVAVMSGHWVQGGRPAVLDKWTRAKLALLGGVDLILELPTVWAVSSAESFAKGAVALLAGTGVIDVLSFGSECGEVDKLRRIASFLNGPVYQAGLRRFIGEGMPFAAARQEVVREFLGPEYAAVLDTPNNNLGVEYLRALEQDGWAMGAITVRREGAPHDSLLEGDARPAFLSATQLRTFLARDDWAAAEPYLPHNGLGVLRENWNGVPTLERVERGLLARLRTMTAEDWSALPDSGAAEGLPPRLERAGKQCRSLEEFLSLAKPKHWTNARMRRLLVWAWLGLTQADCPDTPPYLRVLGFHERGRAVLKAMKGQSQFPILTKSAHAHKLNEPGKALFDLESRCTDLYDLCLEQLPIPHREWTTGPVRL